MQPFEPQPCWFSSRIIENPEIALRNSFLGNNFMQAGYCTQSPATFNSNLFHKGGKWETKLTLAVLF